jgi:D-mannonate dehydratase
MLAIGIFAPYGADHDQNIAFCQDTDVHHIVHSAAGIAGEGPDGVPAASTLTELVKKYADSDVSITALTPPRISLDAFTDADARNSELDTMQHIIEGMGQAGIPLLHLYLRVEPLPPDATEKERLWNGMVDVYRELSEIATNAGVRVSTHHYHLPDRLLWNYDTMSRLLNEVQSPVHGVTYCQGKSQMAGDDLVSDILNYGEQIFMFHIRDVITRVSNDMPPEVEKRLMDIGYLEVAFGTGEVDMVGCIRALKQINYQGQIYPEHFPAIAGDRAAGVAWTIGYIRAMDEAVES